LVTLDSLNRAAPGDFAAVLGDVFEHAPWVAEQAASARPFATVAALHDAMMAAVTSAPDDRIVTFLRGHPELSGAAALAGTMASHSTAEQAGLGLDRPADDIAALNAAYSARFGIPFIVCVRRHTRNSLLSAFRRRLDHDAASEQTAALQEIRLITRLRLAGLVTGPGMPIVNGSLTTHVLDTSIGRPAAGIAVDLRELGETMLLAQGVTDAQGRTHQPLLHGAPLRIGRYELLFHIGAYFAGRPADDPPFLDVIPVRFGISEPESHYHIPLLVSPGAYSTYRGS
jgi:2-oxo-4-hydroxy-4-carboxy-5-ureidoimidazoline decarboxylase